MLIEIIQFLVQNPDAIEKVKEGTLSFSGLTSLEQSAIVEVFTNTIDSTYMSINDYWK